MNLIKLLKSWFFRKSADRRAHEMSVDHVFSSESDVWKEETGNSHPADEVFAEEFLDAQPRKEGVDRILSTKRGTTELLEDVKERKTRMKLIVGLGNPGSKYVGTRHNIGYEVLAEVAKRHGDGRTKTKFQGEFMEGKIGNERVVFISPVTYMNLSGQCVRPFVDFYKVEISDVLIICDDVNLPVGKLRIRTQGSAGGQKGLADCIRALATDQVTRLRIGVGDKPASWDLADYVLGHFKTDEKDVMDTAFIDAANAVVAILNDGIDAAMNRYNRTKKEDDESD